MPSTRVLATAVAALAIPAAAIAAPKPQPTAPTIAASAPAVTFGKAVDDLGHDDARTLRSRCAPMRIRSTTRSAQVATTTSNAAGAYSFTVKPDTSTHYRAEIKQGTERGRGAGRARGR